MLLRLLLTLLALLSPGSLAQRAREEGFSAHAVKHSASASHVFLIVLENHSYSQVIGQRDAPYINHLARAHALFTRYFAVSHPSLPNYLALLGGSTFGITSDCTDCTAQDPNLASQLSGTGIAWRAYMESMPRPCFPDADHGLYAKKHDPFLYFPSITSYAGLCDQVVPATGLSGDLAAGALASFSWITPNLCHDAHDCPLSSADRYLAGLVPKLLSRLGPNGFLALTFDEGSGGGSGGGRVATILAGPPVKRGVRIGVAANHYSLLRTLERAFGVPYLREAANASDLGAAFKTFPRVP